MGAQPKHDSVAPLRLALGTVFCAVAFYVFLAHHGARERDIFLNRPQAWQFFYYPVMGGLLGLAIEAASRSLSDAFLEKTARYLAWGAVLVITVDLHRPADSRMPFGPGHYFAEPVPPWQFFSLFVGVLLGLAIEAASLLRGAKFRKATRDIMLWAVVGIMVAAIAIECISEARAVRGPKNEGEIPEILVMEDFLRKLIVLPIAALVGGGVGFLIRRQARCDGMSNPMTDNPHEPRSSRMVGLFGILCGIGCGIVGSVLGGCVAPSIEQREFPELCAASDLPLAMTPAGILFGGCFGWLFGWLLTALLCRRHLRTQGDHILIWVFGLFAISAATAAIVLSGWSFKPNHWPPQGGPDVTVELISFLFDHAAWLIIALVAYALSSGPAYTFASKHISFFRTVELVYAPLFWVTGPYSPLRKARHRYMEFWLARGRSVEPPRS